MITYILILVNVAVFLLIRTNRLDPGYLGSSYHNVFNRKEYYRIITGAFTHVEILHLFCNMSSLLNVGTFVESAFGSGKMLLIYFVSMILGRVFAMLIRHGNHDDYTESIGASGAICGLLGTYFLVVVYFYGLSALQTLIRPIASLLVMSILPGVDGTSHFCCMGVGMAVTFLLLLI
jgi:rhomboid protease GluP